MDGVAIFNIYKYPYIGDGMSKHYKTECDIINRASLLHTIDYPKPPTNCVKDVIDECYPTYLEDTARVFDITYDDIIASLAKSVRKSK